MKVILKKTSLYESFDFNSDEDESFDNIIKSHRYKKFLEENYTIDGDTIFYEKDGKTFVDVKGDVKVKNHDITSLVEGNLRFGYVAGSFNCSKCKQLTSLEGSPEKIKRGFFCWDCSALKSLEGAPRLIRGEFNCSNCHSLVTLEGGPKTVLGMYSCAYCSSLTSLKGAPHWVGTDFYCKGCKSLVSFEGKPETIGGRFIADKIKKQKSIVESFDFNTDEMEDFDETISSSKWLALIKKAVQESIEISVEKKVPRKIFPKAMKENTKKLSMVIKPLRNLIKTADPSNDVILHFQLDRPLEGVRISCGITEGTNKSNLYIASSYPAAPIYIGEFIHRIYLVILHNFGLIRNLSEFTKMIKKESEILYSL